MKYLDCRVLSLAQLLLLTNYLTITVIVFSLRPARTVIFAFPFFLALITPFVLTEATFFPDEMYLTLSVAVRGVTAVLSFSFCPFFR